jgi:hypothetical protein
MIYETLHRKLKIEQHKPHWNPGWTQMFRKDKQFLLHYKSLVELRCSGRISSSYSTIRAWLNSGAPEG